MASNRTTLRNRIPSPRAGEMGAYWGILGVNRGMSVIDDSMDGSTNESFLTARVNAEDTARMRNVIADSARTIDLIPSEKWYFIRVETDEPVYARLRGTSQQILLAEGLNTVMVDESSIRIIGESRGFSEKPGVIRGGSVAGTPLPQKSGDIVYSFGTPVYSVPPDYPEGFTFDIVFPSGQGILEINFSGEVALRKSVIGGSGVNSSMQFSAGSYRFTRIRIPDGVTIGTPPNQLTPGQMCWMFESTFTLVGSFPEIT